ncbi:hypothetical protein M0805_000838 [Coniferiporia weirii]|nr:hypothetical protein M0805_000838 [Coniferiporia weirii]
MCIGLWSLNHPDYALILCTNRDEYLSRPTINAHFHSFGYERGFEDTYVLSGRDVQAGGSWFGVNRDGRVALLTNITEQHHSYGSSRGHLVSSFLLPGAPGVKQYTDSLTGSASGGYSGFNMLVLSPSRNAETRQVVYEDATLITNSGGGGIISSRWLRSEERRIGGVSNGVDGEGGADWPKVKEGVSRLSEVLFGGERGRAGSSEGLVDELFELLLRHPEKPPANRFQLRTSIQILPLCMSASLLPDAPAIGPEYYGTRLSTVLLVQRDGSVTFIERDIWKLNEEGNLTRGDPKDTRVFRFRLDDKEPKEGQD